MCIMIHSMQLVDHRPTRSPRRMPSAQSPRATRSASALNPAQVSRFSWWREATARRSGIAIRRAMQQVANRQFQQRPCRSPRIALGRNLLFNGHGSAFVYSDEGAVYAPGTPRNVILPTQQGQPATPVSQLTRISVSSMHGRLRPLKTRDRTATSGPCLSDLRSAAGADRRQGAGPGAA